MITDATAHDVVREQIPPTLIGHDELPIRRVAVDW
jgi:hypothetical protein